MMPAGAWAFETRGPNLIFFRNPVPTFWDHALLPLQFGPPGISNPGPFCAKVRQCDGRSREGAVQLIVYYLVFMIAGDFAAYFIGLIVEREFGGQVSLIVFLALYFVFLWIAWLLAVWFSQPRRAEAV